MKKCFICNIVKDITDYYTHPETKDGHLNKCKECCRLYAKNKDTKGYDKNRYENNTRRRLWCVFNGMIQRCNNPKNKRYYRYGARGIRVERNTFQEFYDDVCDMRLDYVSKYGKSRNVCQFDRINNDGNYCKSNIRITTLLNNIRNR